MQVGVDEDLLPDAADGEGVRPPEDVLVDPLDRHKLRRCEERKNTLRALVPNKLNQRVGLSCGV